MNDPGPLALLINNPVEQNIKRFNWMLNQAEDFAGFYTSNQERFSFAMSAMEVILQRITSNKLILLYNNNQDNIMLVEKAKSINTNLLFSDLVIDNILSEEYIRERLEIIERIALRRGYAIIVVHPFLVKQNILPRWIENLNDKNIILTSITEMMKVSNN